MWIHINGRDEKVINPAHIKLFLAEGGYEIDDPTAQKQEEAPKQDVAPDKPSEPDGRQETGDDGKLPEQIGKPAQDTKKKR